MMLPAGMYFLCPSSLEVSESGDELLLLVDLIGGGVASIVFTVAECEQRAIVVQDCRDVGLHSFLH